MPADALDDESMNRLEQALTRIESGIERPDPVAVEVALRLDALIGRVQSELAQSGLVHSGPGG